MNIQNGLLARRYTPSTKINAWGVVAHLMKERFLSSSPDSNQGLHALTTEPMGRWQHLTSIQKTLVTLWDPHCCIML